LPLHLKIAFPYRDRDLIVTSQGVLLYGQDPALPALIRRTNAVMYIIASLLLALGLSARLIQSDIILTAGIGDHSTIIGILLLLCGRLIRSRSLLAMILSVFLLITHWLIGISLAAHLSATSSVTITLVHMVFVIPLFQGIFLIDAWGRQFPPPPHQVRTFWRNVGILAGILLLPLIILIIMTFGFYG